MRLRSLRVTNYKCIDDSDEFSLGDMTCLAGKNEAGKTALLQALHRLNPVEQSEADFDHVAEYPRRRLHEFSDLVDPPVALRTTWELADDDVKAVESIIGRQALRNRTVVATKDYANTIEWTYEVDERAVIRFLVEKADTITPKARQRALLHETVTELRHKLQRLTSPTRGEIQLLEHIQAFRGNDNRCAVSAELRRRLPRFLYFPNYATLPGRVQVDKLMGEPHQSRKDRVFAALLDLAQANAQQLRNADRAETLIANLEGISNHISAKIFEYWSQNKDLRVQFRLDAAKPADPPPFNTGHVFSLRIENLKHSVTVPFDDRSTGFVWFFSFLVWFSQMQKLYGDALIILLDEPGLSLHGRAQADLLRYVKEQLLPRYQVIYTTHSPFMIDTDNILSVRTVEDVTKKGGGTLGTKVGDKVLSTDADTIFPLRAALGYDLTQSLFIGEHCLLVEGPSDLLYLRWASTKLMARQRTALDPRWVVTPVGGIDKLGTFAAIFGGNKLHLAVLTDFHTGEKGKVRSLRESELLEAGHVFSAVDFVDQQEADVEDMLGRSLYVRLVNRCYGLDGAGALPEPEAAAAPTRVLQEVERHFCAVATSGPEFSHYLPAVYLTEHDSCFDGTSELDAALARFERFFEAINQLLPVTS